MGINKYYYFLEISKNFIELSKKNLVRQKYIDVPYSEKDEVKNDGARWDPIRKCWYVPDYLMLFWFIEWYSLTSKCGQALCPSCNDFALHYLDVQIHDDYLCYKCDKPMQIMLFFLLPEDDVNIDSRNLIPIHSELAYIKPPSLIPFAREEDVYLAERFSKTINEKYVMHICPDCGAHQGDNYVVTDMHQETSIVDSFRVSYCAACDKWEIIERFDIWW